VAGRKTREVVGISIGANGEGFVVFDDGTAYVMYRSKNRLSAWMGMRLAQWFAFEEGKRGTMLDLSNPLQCAKAKKILKEIGEERQFPCT